MNMARFQMSEDDVYCEERRWFRFGLRSFFQASIAIAILLGALILIRQYLQSGVVLFRASWPPELLALLEKLPAETRQQVSGLRLHNNSFIDTEYHWRFNAPRETFKTLAAELQMGTADREDLPPRFWLARSWWNRSPSASTQFAATYFWPEKPENPTLEGFNLIVMYDQDRELLYGWLCFEF
jgi:hypothetical protein